jgi:hypothetical protein
VSYTSTEFCDGFSIKLTSSNVDNATAYLWSSGEKEKVVDVKKTGVFSVQTKGLNGCFSVASDSVHTLANYTPPAPILRNLSDTVFCEGGETAITVTPLTDNYKAIWWSGVGTDSLGRFNNARLTVKNTELIKAYLQTSKGCISKASNAIQVVKKALPAVPLLQQIGTYTLAAKSTKFPTEYSWKKDGLLFPNDKSPIKDSIIKVVDEGTYSVFARNSYRIQSSTVNLVCSSGETAVSFTTYDDKGLSVFPNPSRGIVYLESRYDIENATVTIYNMKGQVLLTTTLTGSKGIDLSTLGIGAYILKLVTAKYAFTKMLSIQ